MRTKWRIHPLPLLALSTLTLGILADAVTTVFCLYVAFRVHEAIRAGVPLEKTLYFWYGLSGFMLLDGGYAMVVLAGEPEPPVPVMVLMLRRFLFLGGTAALVSALFDMAGRSRAIPVLMIYYAVLITFIEALTLYENPQTHEQLVWSIQFVYQRESPALLNFFLGLAIFTPLFLAASLVMGRYRHQASEGRRYRLAVLNLGVLVFCVGIVIGFWDNDWFWYGLFENRLAFTIAAGMLFALRPPWIVRRYWKIRRVKGIEQWPH